MASTSLPPRLVRPAPPSRIAVPVVPVFTLDYYTVRQQMLVMTAEKYDILDRSGTPVLFAERPAHALHNFAALFGSGAAAVAVGAGFVWLGDKLPDTGGFPALIYFVIGVTAVLATFLYGMARLGKKRHMTCYADASKTTKYFEVKQNETVSGLTATYAVQDEAGRPLAAISKNALTDVFRKKWIVRDPRSGRVILVAKEDSIVRALLRRLVSKLVLLHFVICQGESDVVLGEFNKEFKIRDVYNLDLAKDGLKVIDRRIAVAIGLLLDTGERR